MPIINTDTAGATVITPSAGKTTLFTDSGLVYLKQPSGTVVPLGGSVSNVSVTTANGISGTVANPTSAPAITLALGAITPTSIVTGAVSSTALTLTGTANLLGDFSNATINNRVLFQSNVTNGLTSVGSIPNGTSTSSDQTAYNTNTGLNASFMSMGISATTADIISGITGSGTYRNLQISTGGGVKAILTTTGLLGLGVSPTRDLELAKNATSVIANKSATGTAAISGALTLERARGTVTSPTAVTNGDTLGTVNFSGYGTSFQNSANITALASETFTGTVGGTALTFNTVTAGSVVNSEKMRITETGNVVYQASGADISNMKSQNGGQLAGMRNRIINGSMLIDQRFNGVLQTGIAGGTFVADRWIFSASQPSKFNSQRQLFTTQTAISISAYSQLTSTSAYAVTTGDTFLISQSIEGNNISDLMWGTSNALPVTLSFWAQSSLTGTFGGVIENGNIGNAYPFTYSMPTANTWTKISITIPGPTTGTWSNGSGKGLIVRFGLGSGTTFSAPSSGSWITGDYVQPTGTVSVVGTNGATFMVTNVQLELGTVATPFEQRSYGLETLLCQRYYQIIADMLVNSWSAGTTFQDCVLPVVMRAVPTTTVGTITYNGGATAYVIFGTTTSRFRMTINGAAGYSYGFGGLLTFNAEL